MSDGDIYQIKDRLTRLETVVEEKWNAHDKRADERWADLMEKIHEMQDSRACVEHSGLLMTHKHKIKSLEDWQNSVNWAIGVVYIALVGAIATKIWGK